jgi:ElaB/YqjD/DUF883 family membrane-anchored ribosome-binding protein
MGAARQAFPPGMAAGAGDEAAAQLRHLQEEVSAIKQTIAELGKPSIGKANGACDCAACKEAASQLAQHARHEAQTAIADLETFARQNPRYALGGALGVGLALGLLLHKH